MDKQNIVVNLSLSQNAIATLDRRLDDWLSTNRSSTGKRNYEQADWVNEFRIYLSQAEIFQS